MEARQNAIEARLGLTPQVTPAPAPAAAPTPQGPAVAPAPPEPPEPPEPPKTSALTAPVHPGLLALRNRCASCHDTLRADRPQDAPAYFEGPTLTAGPAARKKMAAAISKTGAEQMPPEDSGVVLTAQEKADAITFLTPAKRDT